MNRSKVTRFKRNPEQIKVLMKAAIRIKQINAMGDEWLFAQSRQQTLIQVFNLIVNLHNEESSKVSGKILSDYTRGYLAARSGVMDILNSLIEKGMND